MTLASQTCVLLFSGGRDSALAAIRLARSFDHIVLVTIMSPHMTGLDRVRSRIDELKRTIPIRCEWILVGEQPLGRSGIQLNELGCISCHFGYFAMAHAIAREVGCANIACGFVQYQNSWVEQTPYAVSQLTKVMAEHGINLVLPVAEIASKSEVEAELLSNKLSIDSLELKCTRQQPDPGLTGNRLRSLIDKGINTLRAAIEAEQAAAPALERIEICGRTS